MQPTEVHEYQMEGVLRPLYRLPAKTASAIGFEWIVT